LYNIILPTSGPFGAPTGLTVRFDNTNWATLMGGEWYGEADVTGNLTPYVNMSYVEGRDLTRGERHGREFGTEFRDMNGKIINLIGSEGASKEPLPGIAPWETRLGLRFH